jgi:hypothetical protein
MKPAAAAAPNARLLFEDTHADRGASQWVEATTPKVPRISGRVVKPGIVLSPMSIS